MRISRAQRPIDGTESPDLTPCVDISGTGALVGAVLPVELAPLDWTRPLVRQVPVVHPVSEAPDRICAQQHYTGCQPRSGIAIREQNHGATNKGIKQPRSSM
jgi:hypothetical protein